MNKTEIGEIAVANKHSGMNCAQAIVSAFEEYTSLDTETLLDITKTMGTGIGATLEGNCGALTGASVILGLAEPDRRKGMKKAAYIMKEFQKQNGAVVCRQLKGIDTGVVLRSCDDCVRDAACLLEKSLKEDMV